MAEILELIRERVVIWDGGVGSMLIDAGLRPGEAPELWNVKYPEKVRKIHTGYYDAGSDVIQTNTFGGSRIKLEMNGLEDNVYELNHAGAKIAKDVCPKDRFVAGNIGPTGKFLEPMGDYTFSDFEQVFAQQAVALAEGGVDLFSVETMMDVEEAKAAIAGIRSVSDLPIAAEVSFNITKRGFYTLMGNSVDLCINALIKSGADIVGSNCNLGSKDMADLVTHMKQNLHSRSKKYPLIAQANAGQPEVINGKSVYPTTPDRYLLDVITMIKRGLDVVGGCCGTTPEYIRKIHEYVNHCQKSVRKNEREGKYS